MDGLESPTTCDTSSCGCEEATKAERLHISTWWQNASTIASNDAYGTDANGSTTASAAASGSGAVQSTEPINKVNCED